MGQSYNSEYVEPSEVGAFLDLSFNTRSEVAGFAENLLLSCHLEVEMVAKTGLVALNPRATPAGTQKLGAPHPASNKTTSLGTTILGCIRMEARGPGVCDCHEQLLALVIVHF